MIYQGLKNLKYYLLMLGCILLILPVYSNAANPTNISSISDISTGWNVSTPMNCSRQDFPSVIKNGNLYVIGGIDSSNNLLSSIESSPINEDLSIGDWTTSASLPKPLGRIGAVVVDEYLYVVGGSSNSGDLRDIYRAKMSVDGSIGDWVQESTQMNVVRADMGVAAGNGYLYVIGGASGGSRYATVEYAKISTDGSLGVWSYTSSMADIRWKAAAVAANGYLYAIGGVNGSGDYIGQIQRAKINTDGSLKSWTDVGTPFSNAGAPQAVLKNGYLYIIGGISNGSIGYVDVQKAKLNEDGSLGPWTRIDYLKTGRYWHSAVASDSAIYALGGVTKQAIITNGTEYLAIEKSPLPPTGLRSVYSHDSEKAELYWITGNDSGIDGYNIYRGKDTTNFVKLNSTLIKDTVYVDIPPGKEYLYQYLLRAVDTTGAESDNSDIISVYIGVNPPASTGWLYTASMIVPRQAFGSVAVKNHVYAIGGVTLNERNSNSEYLTDIEYATIHTDLSLGNWKKIANLKRTLARTGTVVVGDQLYVIGGTGYGGDSRSVYRATIHEDGSLGEWVTESTRMIIPRADLGIAFCNGYMYALGGAAGTSRYKTVEYAKVNSDGSLGSWAYTNSLSIERWKAAALTAKGYLYAIGGVDYSGNYIGQIQRAKINSDGSLEAWTDVGVPFLNPGAPQVVIKDGYFVVLGGIANGGGGYFEVQKAKLFEDGSLGDWITIDALNMGRYWHSAVATDAAIYAMGGYTHQLKLCNSVEYLMVDSFQPPSTPTGLQAVAGNHKVTLSWNSVSDSDMDGYHLYRKQAGIGFVKINLSLIKSTGYIDTTVLNDTTYTYVVVAVDTQGLESAYSSEVSITPGIVINDFFLADDTTRVISDFPADSTVLSLADVSWLETYGDATGVLKIHFTQPYQGVKFTLQRPEWFSTSSGDWYRLEMRLCSDQTTSNELHSTGFLYNGEFPGAIDLSGNCLLHLETTWMNQYTFMPSNGGTSTMYCQLVFKNYNTVTATVYIDNIQITRVSKPAMSVGYINPGDFDTPADTTYWAFETPAISDGSADYAIDSHKMDISFAGDTTRGIKMTMADGPGLPMTFSTHTGRLSGQRVSYSYSGDTSGYSLIAAYLFSTDSPNGTSILDYSGHARLNGLTNGYSGFLETVYYSNYPYVYGQIVVLNAVQGHVYLDNADPLYEP